jgi:hypothetical protein
MDLLEELKKLTAKFDQVWIDYALRGCFSGGVDSLKISSQKRSG